MLNKLSLKYKMIILLSIPVIGLIIMTVFVVTEKLSVLKEMIKLNDFKALGLPNANLVSALRKEQRITVAFIAIDKDRFVQELQKSRKDTDAKLRFLMPLSRFSTRLCWIERQSPI